MARPQPPMKRIRLRAFADSGSSQEDQSPWAGNLELMVARRGCSFEPGRPGIVVLGVHKITFEAESWGPVCRRRTRWGIRSKKHECGTTPQEPRLARKGT